MEAETFFNPAEMLDVVIDTCRTLPSLLRPSSFSANTLTWWTVAGLRAERAASSTCPYRVFSFTSRSQLSVGVVRSVSEYGARIL